MECGLEINAPGEEGRFKRRNSSFEGYERRLITLALVASTKNKIPRNFVKKL